VLDFDTCAQAMLDRDPEYDGVFFIAVKTTGVYCRPVCRVRQPLLKNVRFYQTAAAAEREGFRPCLRCRPESAPLSPAWNGTKTTVTKGMRLISEGALDQGSVENLAERLGVSTRHLGRLFREHVGATPFQVARTMRVQRAKRLLDSSRMSITDIALESGFKSLRAFHRTFRDVYGRPPSTFR